MLKRTGLVHLFDHFLSNKDVKSVACDSLLKRFFHGSNPTFGRRSGSSALDSKPRDFSKKQKKRHANLNRMREVKIDQRKEAIKKKHAGKSLDMDKMKEMVAKLTEEIRDPVRELMHPNAFLSSFDSKQQSPDISLPPINPIHIFNQLRAFRDNQLFLSEAPTRRKDLTNFHIERVPQSDVYRALTLLVRQKQFEVAEEMLELVESKASGYECGIDFYSELISSALKAGNLTLVPDLFDRMVIHSLI